jgi:hypothetical protein
MFETASSETYFTVLWDKGINEIKIWKKGYEGEDVKEILPVEFQWTSVLVVD